MQIMYVTGRNWEQLQEKQLIYVYVIIYESENVINLGTCSPLARL